jgi:UDP-glucuronate decarboxylase
MDNSDVVLVTGGCGFLGLNLLRHLAKNNLASQIIIVDNGITCSFTNAEIEITRLQLDHPSIKFHLYKLDICSPEIQFLKARFKMIHQIYHFASLASPVFYKQFPQETLDVGYIGTKNMLELCRYYKCKFLFSSTSEVYGDPLLHPQAESYYGNVNSYGTRSCFSSDTEILTKDGFKLFSELTKSDYVATLNDDNCLEYNVPDEIIKERYIGTMYEFKNLNIDLNVTPNHKMYVRKRDHAKFCLLPADSNINWNRSGLQKTCIYEGDEEQWFYFPDDVKGLKNQKNPFVERVEMDAWVEFMGYYLTEGHTRISTQKKKHPNGKVYENGIFKVQISQSESANPEKFEKIKQCLDKLPFHYNISKAGNSYFVISNKQLAFYLKRFGKSKDKFIPNELLSLSRRQLQILLDALVLGDGTISKKNSRWKSFFSCSYQLMTNVQEILIKLGTFGNIAKPSNRTVYHMTINSRPERNYTYSSPTINEYDGFVYCVNVKNHVVLVRRNGKVVFCGNCYDESKRVAESLIYTYKQLYNIDTRIVRIFNTYGPHMNLRDGRIVTEIAKGLLLGEPLQIYGNGLQTRSLNYVDDTITSIVAVMQSDYSSPVNVGSDNELSINQLVVEFQKIYREHFDPNSTLNIHYTGIDKDDPKTRKPCLKLHRQILGVMPVTPLDIGLYRTLQYFSQLL